MKRSILPMPAWAVLLIGIGLIAFSACDDGNGESPTPTTAPFRGTLDPVQKPEGESVGQPLLVDVRAAEHDGFDRIIFEFDAEDAGFRAEYVDEATGCGSGLPVEIAGAALLQVRITPVAAHDEAGAPTFAQQELAPGLPSILEAEQTCDFEGAVTWVVGLAQEAEFNALTLRNPFRIVVDVAHP
jgi:hypothetical protein